jgi:hypothetical protein
MCGKADLALKIKNIADNNHKECQRARRVNLE